MEMRPMETPNTLNNRAASESSVPKSDDVWQKHKGGVGQRRVVILNHQPEPQLNQRGRSAS
jgi:hypothetical protein